jgi:hypothetical protein
MCLKKELGKYLLQTRYKSSDKIIQEAGHIYFHKNNNEYITSDISVIWNYDGQENKTWFTICINDSVESLNNYMKIYLQNNFQDYNYDDNHYVCTLSGIHTDILIS